MIRRCTQDDVTDMVAVINDAAQAYRGIIPADRWHDPYMPRAELISEVADGVEFWGYETADSGLIGVMGIQARRKGPAAAPVLEDSGAAGGDLGGSRQPQKEGVPAATSGVKANVI